MDDGLREFQRHRGLRADGQIQLALGGRVGGPQLTPHPRDTVHRYPQIDMPGLPDPQHAGAEHMRPYDGSGMHPEHEHQRVDVDREPHPRTAGWPRSSTDIITDSITTTNPKPSSVTPCPRA